MGLIFTKVGLAVVAEGDIYHPLQIVGYFDIVFDKCPFSMIE